MLSGAGSGFFQPTIGADQLQESVVINHCFAAARAYHPDLQTYAGLDRTTCCRVIRFVDFFPGMGRWVIFRGLHHPGPRLRTAGDGRLVAG